MAIETATHGTDPAANLPLVSVIVPCRNEEDFIGMCLESLLRSGYPHDRLEILVIDGLSEDRTAEVVREYAARCPAIKLFENPSTITPAALNIGIRNANGEYIMRMDAHAEVEPGYIAGCVEAIQRHGVDNVGGAMQTVPQRPSPFGTAIAVALSHPFGVGNSAFRTGSRTVADVDTVFGGFYRRDVFRRIGCFNERLARSQDIEFNIRLKRAGGRILLVPGIASRYYARSGFGSFLKQNWSNGVWVIRACLLSDALPVRGRHLVPGMVAALAAILLLLSLISGVALTALLAACILHALLTLSVSLRTAIQRRDARLLFVLPLVFPALHLSYGAGTAVQAVSSALRAALRSAAALE